MKQDGIKWYVKVCYRSETGQLDVDYIVDDLKEVYLAISQGPGIECLETMSVERDLSSEPAISIEKKYKQHEEQFKREKDGTS